MDKPTITMDDASVATLEVYRSEQFRVPSKAERELGLWVDRIGEGVLASRPDRLRILGQYCHIIVLAGEGVYTSKQHGTHPVKTGDCMIQLPEDPCAYFPHDRWRTRWITWNGPESKTLEELGYIVRGKPVFHDRRSSITHAHEKLKPIMQRGDRADALRRKSIVLQLLLELHDTQKGAAGSFLGHPRMEEALQIIHSRFNQDLPVTSVAAEVGLSPTHFRRVFRSYTGKPPLAYITDLRVAEAKRLLREGWPIKAVANEVGYEDTFYFMRVFKKIAGMPPGLYTRKHS